MSWREVTALVILLLPVVASAYDFAVYVWGGNSATISRTLLDATGRYPLIALAFAFTMGLFAGHVFLPQHLTKENYPTVAKMVRPR